MGFSRANLNVIAGVVAAGLLIGGVTYWRGARMSQSAPSRDDAEVLRARGVASIARATMAGIDESDTIRESLHQAARMAGSGLSSEEARRISTTIEKFLGLRFGRSSDPAQFMLWREEQGYQRRPLEELRKQWFLDDAYRTYLDKPLDAGASWDDVFAEMMLGQDAFEKGRTRPRGVGVGPDDLRIVVRTATRADPGRAAVDGALGDVLSYGGPLMISHSWWRPGVSYDELMAQYGKVKTATVGFVIDFVDGKRRPAKLMMYQDPKTGGWWIDGYCHGNYEKADMSSARWEY